MKKIKKYLRLFLTFVLMIFILTACQEPGAPVNDAAGGSSESNTESPEAEESGDQQEEAVEATTDEAAGDEAGTEETAEAGTDYEELREEMQKATIANPWGDTQSLDVAVESSGVEFTPPSEASLPPGLGLTCYRYMEGTIEADYEGGSDELSIRKSDDVEGQELSGDYNKYPDEWDEVISGITVHCLGQDGLINTAFYDKDGGHYALSYNIGQPGRGISAGELQSIIDGEEGTTAAYTFRTPELRLSHFTKHGIDMGFTTEQAYEEAAARVITNPRALHKTEAEDGDDVYYVVDTNEFVVLSKDGYIRTYFNPDRGKAYFDKQ